MLKSDILEKEKRLFFNFSEIPLGSLFMYDGIDKYVAFKYSTDFAIILYSEFSFLPVGNVIGHESVRADTPKICSFDGVLQLSNE